MTAHVLDLLEAPGDIIVEGGFNRSPAFAAVLARLMPGRNVVVAPTSGAAEGAAMLARWGEPHAPPKLAPAEAWRIPGLDGLSGAVGAGLVGRARVARGRHVALHNVMRHIQE